MKRKGKIILGGIFGGGLGAIAANKATQKKKSIWDAPERFAKTGNTLQFGETQDPGTLTMPSGPGAFTSAGGYVGAPQQSTYVNDLYAGLGIEAPQDTSAEISNAGRTALNIATQQQAAADADRFARQGITNSGTAAALNSIRGINYGAQRADIDMKAKMDAADRKAAFDAMRAELAGDYGSNASEFNLQSAAQKNQFGLDKNAQILQGKSILGDYNLGRAGILNDESFRRSMGEYEANVMFPISMAAARKGANQQMVGNIVSGGLQSLVSAGAAAACWVAEVIYGPEAQKTHDARLYASTVDTPFTLAYREHGQKWAKAMVEDEALQAMFKPIWDEMAKAGATMRRTGIKPEVR